MIKRLLINNKNTPKTFKNIFQQNIINFDFENRGDKSKNIDKYISDLTTRYLLQIKLTEILYIKDNLSSNYLELLGLRLAYHIRLSESLGNARYIPIVILSDIGRDLLNQLDISARILFTKNIFIIENTEEAINELENLHSFKNLIKTEYNEQFLNLITINAPEKSTNHSIANEWAIDRWARFLKVDSVAITANKEKINSMLYFKYLTTLNPDNFEDMEYDKPELSGNILYIDDEGEKGWNDILSKYFNTQNSTPIVFEPLVCNFSQDESFLVNEIKEKISRLKDKPDLIILDLRLIEKEYKDDIKMYTGIQVRDVIKQINPGIQVIMFTATSQSLILDELYKHNILGYIKKEHPEDKSLNTKESLDKLSELVDIGLSRAYLKDIWSIRLKMIENLDDKPFLHYFPNEIEERENDLIKELRKEIIFIFAILDSNINNKLNNATVSIVRCIETLGKIFIRDDYNYSTRTTTYYFLGDVFKKPKRFTLEDQVIFIFEKLHQENFFTDNYKKKGKRLKKLIRARNNYVHTNENTNKLNEAQILSWFKLLEEIVEQLLEYKK